MVPSRYCIYVQEGFTLLDVVWLLDWCFLSNLILEISLSLSFKLRDMTSHSQATPHPTPPVGLPPSLGKEAPSRSLKTKGTLISQTFKVKEVKAS